MKPYETISTFDFLPRGPFCPARITSRDIITGMSKQIRRKPSKEHTKYENGITITLETTWNKNQQSLHQLEDIASSILLITTLRLPPLSNALTAAR